MKEYEVSLDIISEGATVTQIAQLFGVQPHQLVCKKFKQKTVWKLLSDCGKQKPLDDHITAILSKTKRQKLPRENVTVKGLVFNVGVFYDSVTCTVNLTGAALTRLISQFPDISIEVSCYPSEG